MIQIFTTGGSIDKTYSTQASDFVVGEPQIAAILAEANVNLDYTIEPLLRKDSLQITDEDRSLIAERVAACPHTQVVITHGTDTMTVTAAALAHLSGKTIVLTGAMQPAAFKKTDAALNIGGAIAAVQILPPGVYIVMSGRVFRAHQARKNPRTDQFESST
jgi:L-asparaginase